MDLPKFRRKYTPEEKQQLIANLDLEVTHKTRQFEAWLKDALNTFIMHQEGQILRIPKPVRQMTMREFQKYDGDIQAALRGMQQAKFGEGPFGGETDKNARKRKWVASHESEAQASGSGSAGMEAESSKATKSARLEEATPKKKVNTLNKPGSAQRSRNFPLNRTPGTMRTMGRLPSGFSPSPHKSRQPPSTLNRPPSRPVSPSKPGTSSQFPKPRPRPPSSAVFNPVLPPKAPAYPNPRLPRLNESMLSVNGSPIANPYDMGLGWLRGTNGSTSEAVDDGSDQDGGTAKSTGKAKEQTVKQVNHISIRRDPSFVNGFHSRTNSQTSVSSSQATGNSRTKPPLSRPPPSDSTPVPPSRTLPGSALVAIPTKDGHLLEFDPLMTSPRSVEALDITDSAKKQVKKEVSRLVQAAVDKWKIT